MMGMYNTYGDTQLKVGPCEMNVYQVGDAVNIPDGVYVGWDGLVVIQDGRLVAEYPQLIDSHGGRHDARDVLGRAWHREAWLPAADAAAGEDGC